jgi:hypothetical protein
MIIGMARQSQWIYPAFVGVVAAVYFAAPGLRVAAVAVVGAGRALCVASASATLEPPRRAAWLLAAGGIMAVALGEVAYNIMATGGHADPFPSWRDLCYLASYLPLAVGLLWLGIVRRPSRNGGPQSGRAENDKALGLNPQRGSHLTESPNPAVRVLLVVSRDRILPTIAAGVAGDERERGNPASSKHPWNGSGRSRGDLDEAPARVAPDV